LPGPTQGGSSPQSQLGPQPTTAVPHYVAPVPATAPTNQLAIVSLAAGVACYFILPVIGAVIAVITGHMARGQIRRTGESGNGLALIGLILGYVHLLIGLLIGLFVVLVVLGFLGFFASQH